MRSGLVDAVGDAVAADAAGASSAYLATGGGSMCKTSRKLGVDSTSEHVPGSDHTKSNCCKRENLR